MSGHYVRSPSTRMMAAVCLISYLSYASAHGGWTNFVLIGVSVFAGAFLLSDAKLSNKAEQWASDRFGFVTAGRLGRFVPRYAFNLTVLWIMQWGGALNREGMASVGGVVSAALIATLASQGVQYLGIRLAERGIGDANRNVLAGLSANVVLTAFGTAGLPFAREAFLVVGLGFGTVLFSLGFLSNIRSKFAPKGGIRVSFGTFNPFCDTRVAIEQGAIECRGFDKVINPTLIAGLHVEAFRKRQLRVARLRGGFGGVNAGIRRRRHSARLRGPHGRDLGDMFVRQVYDESGLIYPRRILRRDGVSATAIGRDAKGMTSGVVTGVLAQLSANLAVVTAGDRCFRNDNGVLTEGT